MFGVVKTLKIPALGPLLTSAGVRRRQRSRSAGREDGDVSVSLEEAIELARGAFKDSSGPSTDEMTRMNREEEQEIEERKYGPDPT
jgi:hypothetical protein